MLENSSQNNVLIMRAYNLIHQTSNMVFIGIYSLDTFEPLALADRERVCVNITEAMEDDPASNFIICLDPDELRAMTTHIRTRDNVLIRIDIAGLRYVCLRTECNCMTGMSNFNTDIDAQEANKILYKITQKRYSHTEVAEGFHALQISAMLKEDKIVVGISKSGEESSLKVLKQMFETHDLQLRPSTKADRERRRDAVKRETSFCEDWRKATIRSIETLKSVGPFTDYDISDDDDSPLVSNIQATATSPLPMVNDDFLMKFGTDVIDDVDDKKSKTQGFVRRPSRATMV
ncbi:hypothetical protein ACF0H5_008390 [Mactra antiquata]